MLAQSCQASGGTLPAGRQETTGKSSRVAEKPARPLVLIVDDEPLIRWAIGETLEHGGYEISEAGDARSAMQSFGDHSDLVDLVLLDLWLPDAADFRVLSSIRRMSPRTPVIVMTSHGSPDITREACRLGAFAVVDKPFELDTLPPLVEAAIVAGRR